jgi:hypothetical protein
MVTTSSQQEGGDAALQVPGVVVLRRLEEQRPRWHIHLESAPRGKLAPLDRERRVCPPAGFEATSC